MATGGTPSNSWKNAGTWSRSNVLDIGSAAMTVIGTGEVSRWVMNCFIEEWSGSSLMWKAITTVLILIAGGKCDVAWGLERNVIGTSQPSRRINVRGNCSRSGLEFIFPMMSVQVKAAPVARSSVKAVHQRSVKVGPSRCELLMPLGEVAAMSSTLAPLTFPRPATAAQQQSITRRTSKPKTFEHRAFKFSLTREILMLGSSSISWPILGVMIRLSDVLSPVAWPA